MGFLGKIDLLRNAVGLATPVADPLTATGRADLLFRERAFWMFATGARLGDLRRMIAFYGRSAASLFPTGAYPLLGGSYGTDANLPVPASAPGPGFTGCTVRTS
jgi:hypothetical protein